MADINVKLLSTGDADETFGFVGANDPLNADRPHVFSLDQISPAIVPRTLQRVRDESAEGITLESLGYRTGDATSAVLDAIAQATETGYAVPIEMRADKEYIITDDVDFGLVPLVSKGWVRLTPNKTLTFSGGAINGQPIPVSIARIWDGTSFAPTLSEPQVRLLGVKNSHCFFGIGAWLELFAQNSATVDGATAYNIIQSNMARLSINGGTGGWVNRNWITGRINRIGIGTVDGGYHHNDNIIHGVIENQGQIDLGFSRSNLIIGRFEGVNTVNCTSDSTANIVAQDWAGESVYECAFDIGATVTDAGDGNRFVNLRWLERRLLASEVFHVPASTASDTTIGTVTKFVMPGTVVRLKADDPTAFWPYARLMSASGADITEAQLNGPGWNSNISTDPLGTYPSSQANGFSNPFVVRQAGLLTVTVQTASVGQDGKLCSVEMRGL